MARYPAAATDDEKSTALAWLSFHQDVLLAKIEGLDDEQLRHAVVPSGLNLLGLVKHVAYVHHRWFHLLFLGAPQELPVIDREAEFAPPREQTLDEIFAIYRGEMERSRRIVQDASMDDACRGGGERAGTMNLRWIVGHLVEELARHNGHADILRELIDGTTGST